MNRLKNRRGITLVEAIVASSLLAGLVVMGAPLLKNFFSGHSSATIRQATSISGQEIATRIQHALLSNRRLFSFGTPIATSYLSSLDLSQCAAPAAWNRLSTVAANGVLSPNLAGFLTANVGNSIFFAQGRPFRDVTVTGQNGTPVTYRIDIFAARYFFLAEDPNKTVLGQPRIELWDWQSIDFPSKRQILEIDNLVVQARVVNALVAMGYTIAWDFTDNNFPTAFARLNGEVLTPLPTPTLTCASATPLIAETQKLTQGDFRCGISPNTPNPNPLPVAVPAYGSASGNAPAGFEVLTVGPAQGRQVLARMVLAAEGPHQSPWAREQTLFVTVSDQW